MRRLLRAWDRLSDRVDRVLLSRLVPDRITDADQAEYCRGCRHG